MVVAQYGCLFASILTVDATLAACSGQGSAAANWNNANTCPSGSTINTEPCLVAADTSKPICGSAACCAKTCANVPFLESSCDAADSLKLPSTTLCTGSGIPTGSSTHVGYANTCHKSLCCVAGTGATCGSASTGAKAKGFCGPSKIYDSTKSSKKCKAASSAACVSEDPTDVHRCCKASPGQKCSASNFVSTFGVCPAGQSYKTALANNQCAAALCVTTDGDDLKACCSVNTGQTCSAAATVDGWCPPGSSYDAAKATKKCKATPCNKADKDDQQACCKKSTGEQCSASKAATTDGWCPAGQTYDAAKASNACKATTLAGGCVSTVKDDQNACCSTTKGSVTCQTFFSDAGICSDSRPGYQYKKAAAAALCVATCDSDKLTDTNTCCMASTGQMCKDGDFENTMGKCPAGESYKTALAKNKCSGMPCETSNEDDLNACCSVNTGQKCSDGATADGWCPPGQSYDISRANMKCKGSTCDSTDLDDQKACCSKTTGSVACKSYFLDAGVCSVDRPGYQYNKDAANDLCVSTCASDKLTDTNTCCKASVGQYCEDAGISQGWCPAGSFYDEGKKKNKCVEVGGCDSGNADDANACCSPLAGAAKCGDVVGGFMTPGMCGAGMSYDENMASRKCAGDKCSSANKDDIKQCCKANEGEGTCAKLESSFCGAGKSLDAKKSTSQCTGKTCSLSNADDVLTCCMDNTGAACNDVKNGAKAPGFCGLGFTFNLEVSNNCKGEKCVSGDQVDYLACCKANSGEACSNIADQSAFCGPGKVFDPAASAKLCASTICSASSAEDVDTCCKIAPVTTTKKTTTTKNGTTPGTTGSGQANSVCTVAIILGIFSLLIN